MVDTTAMCPDWLVRRTAARPAPALKLSRACLAAATNQGAIALFAASNKRGEVDNERG